MNRQSYTTISILTLTLLSLAFTGCGGFSLVQSLGLYSLSMAPDQVTVAIGDSVTFTANDGAEPYVFSILSGAGTIDSVSGSYTAPPVPGTDIVMVTDNEGAWSISTVVAVDPASEPLTIAPMAITIPATTSIVFTALGGVTPYTFAIVSGGGSIDSASGAFTAPGGAGSVTVSVTDSESTQRNATVTVIDTLKIAPRAASLQINDILALSASGGTPPYSYAMESGTGSVTSGGSYTAPAAAGTDVVKVTDFVGATDTSEITVEAPVVDPLVIVPPAITLSTGAGFTFTAIGGTPPYNYSVIAGGGSFAPGTGAFTAPGSAGSVTVRVTDADSTHQSATVTIVENLKIIPGAASVLVNDSLGFSASGGTPPYTYALTSGTGSVTSGGVYTAPAAAGTEIIEVTDSVGAAETSTITVVAPAVGSLAILPPAITLATGAGFTFTAIDGTPPYTFSIAAGGGSIDAASGAYTAPLSAGPVTVRVTDTDSAQQDSTVTIVESLSITPQTASIPANSGLTFTASGGTAPYIFTMESGTGSVTPGGDYTAAPAPGTDEVRVTDNDGSVRVSVITVTAQEALHISPSAIVVLNGSGLDFTAYGGSAPYTFSMVSGNGSITPGGTYTASGGPGSAVVRVTDSLAAIADASVSVVNTGVLSINPSVVTVEQGKGYEFTAWGGTPPYIYSLVSGNGSIISSTGEYQAGAALGTDIVQVIDVALDTVQATIHVAPSAPTNLVVNGAYGGPLEIGLTWIDNSAGEDGFKIERKPSGGTYIEIGQVIEDVEVYVDSDPVLNPGDPYSYRVRAFKDPNPDYSSYSNDDFAIPNP